MRIRHIHIPVNSFFVMEVRSDAPNWRVKNNKKQICERMSYGIACVRRNQSKLEVLMVRKRHTYAYSIFVHGRYQSCDRAGIKKLFNEMTVEEKYDILSLNFNQMWYRIWLNNVNRKPNYFHAKNKYESTFVADGGALLHKLMEKTSHGSLLWELPKGHKKNKNESSVVCAVREFSEETLISKGSYRLMKHNETFASRAQTYIDDNTKYTNTYYIAYTRHVIEPRIDFSIRQQIEEISDIAWMDIEKIRQVDSTGRLVPTIGPIFNYVRKYT